MAVLSLNTNLPSLQTQRRVADSTSALSQTYERLSSGLRVSRASDDAAGLAVASGLDVDTRVFSQGLRNLSDGVSVTNIAEGALNELTNIVTRLEELAEQAANGTLGAKQRAALDAEAQALSKEYFRIARTTEFNGLKLFDGSLQGLSLQAGYAADGAIQCSIGGKLGSGSFDTALNSATGANPAHLAVGDFNADGIIDTVSTSWTAATMSVLLGNGDGTFRGKTDYATGNNARSVTIGDLNADGILDIVTANYSGAKAGVFLGNGDGSFKGRSEFSTGAGPYSVQLGDLNGDGALDIVAANFAGSTASVIFGNGDGSFRSKTDLVVGGATHAVVLGDVNGDNTLDIVASHDGLGAFVFLGNGDGTFQAKLESFVPSPFSMKLGDLNGDGALDLISAAWASDTLAICLGNNDGTFESPFGLVAGEYAVDASLGDLNGDGALDIVSANFNGNSSSIFLGNGDGTFKTKTELATGTKPNSVALTDLNADGAIDILCPNYGSASISALLSQTRDGVSPLLAFSLKTKADAKWALELMKQKLTQLSQQRGVIGANQSRLSTAVANLQVEREGYQTARSQIMDADVAAESAQLVKTQILQQAGAAVLGQANQAPALALRLIG